MPDQLTGEAAAYQARTMAMRSGVADLRRLLQEYDRCLSAVGTTYGALLLALSNTHSGVEELALLEAAVSANVLVETKIRELIEAL